MSKYYKMLILEGGGFFGLIDITFLSYLGKDYDVCKNINSISGCSIGGIESCALMSGSKSEDIQKAFINYGSDIFKKRSYNPLNIPWYSDEGLTKVLKKFVGNKTIRDTKDIYPNTSMFVPALNMTKNKMKVYDNVSGQDDNCKLLDVALDTSAACFYFPVRSNSEGDAIIDGGLREVAPVVTHATGVKSKLNIEFRDMDVFVICAGNSVDKSVGDYAEVNSWNPLDWLTKWIISDITISNQCTSKFWGEHLGFHSFTWFNPINITGTLDDISKADYILQECEMYKEMFLDKWNSFING